MWLLRPILKIWILVENCISDWRKKNLDECSIHRFEEILAREPASDKVRYYLGAVFEEIKEYDNAIEHFGKIQPASTYYPEAITHTAYLYKLQGDYSKAMDAAKDGMKKRADHIPLYVLYASFLEDQQKFADAVSF